MKHWIWWGAGIVLAYIVLKEAADAQTTAAATAAAATGTAQPVSTITGLLNSISAALSKSSSGGGGGGGSSSGAQGNPSDGSSLLSFLGAGGSSTPLLGSGTDIPLQSSIMDSSEDAYTQLQQSDLSALDTQLIDDEGGSGGGGTIDEGDDTSGDYDD